MSFKVGDKVKLIGGTDPDDVYVIETTTTGQEPYSLCYPTGEVGSLMWYDRELTLIETTVDVVNHPQHYSAGMPEGCQVIDVIRAQEADFLHGSVIKYVLRWKFKGAPVEDLKKAQKYLGWLIEQEEAKNV